MGANIRIRTLHDAAQHGFQLRVTCPDCGRSGVYATVSIIDWFRPGRRRSKNPSLEVAGSYFRCDTAAGGCGRLGARLELVPPHRAPDLPKLSPSAYELQDRLRRERG